MYFISFIEECIMNPKYLRYIGGRIEVYRNDYDYASEEIRWFTKELKKFRAFRDEWDMKDVTEEQLKKVKKIAQGFCKYPKLSRNA